MLCENQVFRVYIDHIECGGVQVRDYLVVELVEEMAAEDLKSAERDELVKRHGHRPYDYQE
jgi:hypothetical protein